jgi:sulfur-carrier protein adenylyltransferase/sulfurtransferase
MSLSPAELRRYGRHLSLKEVGTAGQEKLSAARVLVVGVGGLGSPAALYLAAAGVGTIGLLDFDRVEESNLQRQVLFEPAQVGEPKALCAKVRLSALNPHLTIVAHNEELTAENARSLLEDYDLVIDGSDRIDTHYLVNDACVLFRKMLVSAAIYRFEGQITSYRPDGGPCFRCLFPTIDPLAAPSCAEVGVLGVLPGVLGTLQATEAIKLLSGFGTPLLGRLLTYDALDLHFQELRFTRRPDCAVCGESPSITEPIDPPGFCSQRELHSVEVIDSTTLARELRGEGITRGDDAMTIIDVREPEEFVAGHIDGSRNRPLALIEQAPADTLGHDRSRALVFVCRSGTRSTRAGALARRAGFFRVRQLDGGLLQWRDRVDGSLAVV